MSDENNENLSDDLKDKAKDAMDSAGEKASEMKEEAKEAFDGAKEKASEFADEAKEAASEFKEEAKETLNDMKESWNEATNNGENKKLIAGILGIVLGGFGVHKFILGYKKEGIILLVCGLLGFVTCGITSLLAWAVGIIEGIIYLTKSDEEFYETYQANQKPWF